VQNADHKNMIQQGFDTVAAGYDHPSLAFFPETARRLVEHLQPYLADHLLGVCTGTGCVALGATEKLTNGTVTGINLYLATEELIKKQFNAVGITKVDIYHKPLGYQMSNPKMW